MRGVRPVAAAAFALIAGVTIVWQTAISSGGKPLSPTNRDFAVADFLSSKSVDTLVSPGMMIAVTLFDGQFHHSQGYQVAHKPGEDLVHFSWVSMWDHGGIGPLDRFANYNTYTISTGTLNHGFDGESFSLGDFACAGYPNIALGSGGEAHVTLHQKRTPADGIPYTSWVYDFPTPGDVFNDRVEVPTESDTTAALWPRLAVSQNPGGTDIYHVLARGPAGYAEYDCWGTGPPPFPESDAAATDRLIYWRFNGTTWEGPVAIDSTGTLGHGLAADANSEKVATVFHSGLPEDRLDGLRDVAYYESLTEGAGWIDGSELGFGNMSLITNYTDTLGPGAWVHLAAAYDYDGVLHIVWDERRLTGAGTQNALRHWNDVRGTMRTVALGYWDNPASNGGYDLNLTKMTLGIGDGSTICSAGPGDQSNRDYLYVLYTQFGGPSPEEQADHSAAGYMSGELYLAVSNNQGDHWSAPQNLTNTKMPDCDPTVPDSICASEHWASIAQAVDDIHILYMLDLDAGDLMRDERTYPLTWPLPPVTRVMYLRLPGGGADPPYLCPDSIITCHCVCHGDPNCDNVLDVLDAVMAVDVAFREAPAMPDPEPLCPGRRTDVDCGGETNVLDVVRFVNVAFRNEPRGDNFCDPCAP